MRPHLRRAVAADAPALRDLERAASEAALGHVFPPERHPYPAEDVLARWRSTLAEDGVTTLLGEIGAAPVVLVAWDASVVRHLAVAPQHWGRGLGTQALARAMDGLGAATLWCLAENHAALAFYRARGARPTGRTRRAEWPPRPLEIELALPVAPQSTRLA